MQTPTRHVLICVFHQTFEYLTSSENLNAAVRKHKREHFAEAKGQINTVTVLYDGNDETDPYLSALIKWRAEHANDPSASNAEEP